MNEDYVYNLKIIIEEGQGFAPEQLEKIGKEFSSVNTKCSMINLDKFIRDSDYDDKKELSVEPAKLLIIRGGVNLILHDKEAEDLLMLEQQQFVHKRTGNKYRVVKQIIYCDNAYPCSDPHIAVVPFSLAPYTTVIRNFWCNFLQKDPSSVKVTTIVGLSSQTNYDLRCGKCQKVVNIRLGDRNLYYRWKLASEKASKIIEVIMEHGDVYIASDKSCCYDYRRSTTYSLRYSDV